VIDPLEQLSVTSTGKIPAGKPADAA